MVTFSSTLRLSSPSIPKIPYIIGSFQIDNTVSATIFTLGLILYKTWSLVATTALCHALAILSDYHLNQRKIPGLLLGQNTQARFVLPRLKCSFMRQILTKYDNHQCHNMWFAITSSNTYVTARTPHTHMHGHSLPQSTFRVETNR